MKTRSVETVVSNDEHVRLKIFDGDIPADDYWQDMSRLYQGQLKVTQGRLTEAMSRLAEAHDEIRRLRSVAA